MCYIWDLIDLEGSEQVVYPRNHSTKSLKGFYLKVLSSILNTVLLGDLFSRYILSSAWFADLQLMKEEGRWLQHW